MPKPKIKPPIKVLISTLVYNRNWVLPEFFACIEQLDLRGIEASFYFVDNGSDDESFKTLLQFQKEHKANTELAELKTDELPSYDRKTPKLGSFNRLKLVRDNIRKKAAESDIDYLFLVDSDVLIQPDILQRLLAHETDYVAAVVPNNPHNNLDRVNALHITGGTGGVYSDPPNWYQHSCGKTPGLVEVDATGACFIASKKLLSETSFFFECENQRDQRLFAISPGEDIAHAFSCTAAGYKQYLDECARTWHCQNQTQFDEYLEAKSKYGIEKAVQILTDRKLHGITDKSIVPKPCSTCGKKLNID